MSQLLTEKTQEPTPYRRQTLRREGRFPRSSEIVGVIVIGGCVLCLPFFVKAVWHAARDILGNAITSSSTFHDEIDVAALTRSVSVSAFPMFCMLGCGVISLAVLANVLQRSAGWKPERLQPDLSRLSPLTRLTGMASTQKWATGLMSLGRFFVTLPLVAWWLWARREEIAGLSFVEPDELVEDFVLLARQALLVAVGCVFVWAVADYVLQWWALERSIKMTPDEIREEARKRDGDPHINRQRRSRHAQLVGGGVERIELETEA